MQNTNKSFFNFLFFGEGKELKTLILSDFYYQLQGEFEGRKIAPGAFKEPASVSC